MKVRMKFTKTGPIRYVGHLDFMRYFTKAVQRSGLPGVYTGGFSPHLIISFAAPLGVGEETLGDYADVELAYRDAFAEGDELYRLEDIGLINDDLPSAPSGTKICDAMNAVLTDGVRVTDVCRVGQIKTDKAMALVRSAAYELFLKDSFLPGITGQMLSQKIQEFCALDEIIIHKKTKKSEKDMDIKPLMTYMSGGTFDLNPEPFTHRHDFDRKRHITLICATGSTQNLKPSAVLEAFCKFVDEPYSPYGYNILRMDTFAETGMPLAALGKPLS